MGQRKRQKKSDKDPAEREVCRITRKGWDTVIENDLQHLILEYIEKVKGDQEKVKAYLDQLGVEYVK